MKHSVFTVALWEKHSTVWLLSDCLAFEWMGCTLQDVDARSHRRNYRLLKSISKGVLGALAELEVQGLVHTGTHCCHETSRLQPN